MRILLAAVLLVPMTASAQSRTAEQMKTDDCARARKQNKTCVLDMGAEKIEAGTGKGEGERVDIIRFGKSASLIRIRHEFIAEIIKTAEDL
jgi:hypothetical protein